MAITIYNAIEFASARTQVPMIGINTKSGLFSINGAASQKLGFEKDNMVFVALDDKQGMHLIGKIKKGGFSLRQGKNEKGTSFNNSTLSRQIASDLGIKDQSFKLRVKDDTRMIENGTDELKGYYLVRC